MNPVPTNAPAIRGMSYTSFGQHDFTLGEGTHALSDAQAQTAADYIAFNVFVYQDSIESSVIFSTQQTSTDEDIRIGIRDARRLGMRVFLKVNLDVQHGGWRGYINPSDTAAWFASYAETMLHYARLAQSEQAEMFSVGCELLTLTEPKFAKHWRKLISDIRAEYSGKLSYCANWNGLATQQNALAEFEQISFWDALDFIGVDMYQPVAVTDDEIPSLDLATLRLQPMVRLIQRTSERYKRDVIITECGALSVTGSLHAPYDYTLSSRNDAKADETSQNIYYTSVISAFGSQPWCKGIFWWTWESVESVPTDKSYSIRNKKAAHTLKTWHTYSF